MPARKDECTICGESFEGAGMDRSPNANQCTICFRKRKAAKQRERDGRAPKSCRYGLSDAQRRWRRTAHDEREISARVKRYQRHFERHGYIVYLPRPSRGTAVANTFEELMGALSA